MLMFSLNDLKDIGNAAGETTRNIFMNIDTAIYNLVAKIFGLFYDIAQSTFLTGDISIAIFKRIFLILSVFMLFKLIISFLTYILSPDTMSDPKNPGNLGKLIGRVIASLLLLITLIPTGSTNFKYNSSSNFDKNVRTQGILFGTLQSVQDSVIINDHILDKIILGKTMSDDTYEEVGKQTSLTIFSAFIRINTNALTKSDATGLYVCEANPDIYFSTLVEAENTQITNMDKVKDNINLKCNSSINNSYLFEYDLFVSTLIGIAAVVLIFFFTFDVALRSIKLGILRLIAPIPAISYISPKSAKDGAFANYLKILISTYLDLFLRIAIIDIAILLISALTSSSGNTDLINGVNDSFSKVIIIITLLFFAGQAPKFIMQALGIKSNGTGLGFGADLIKGALGGALAGYATGGIAGAAKGLFGGANAGAQHQWAAQNGQNPNMSARQMGLNKGAQLGSGDPNAKALPGSMLGGFLSNSIRGTTPGRVSRSKKDLALQQQNLSNRQGIASNLGLNHGFTDQDFEFLQGQSYRNGSSIVEKTGANSYNLYDSKHNLVGQADKNANGKYEYVDKNGNYLNTTSSELNDFISALTYDNNELNTEIGSRQSDIEKAGKISENRSMEGLRPKFKASNRFEDRIK